MTIIHFLPGITEACCFELGQFVCGLSSFFHSPREKIGDCYKQCSLSPEMEKSTQDLTEVYNESIPSFKLTVIVMTKTYR